MRFSIKNENRPVNCVGNKYKSLRWVAIMVVALFPFFSLNAKKGKKPEETPKDSVALIQRAFADLYTPGLELIRKTTRLDMIDYWKADSVYKAKSELDGVAWLEAMTDNYAKVRVTPVSTVELKVLPLGKKKIVACVYTVGDSVQARDSQIDFYDEALRPLDKGKYFRAPVLSDFFNVPGGASVTFQEIREAVPFPTVAYSLSADSDNLSARLTVEDYISKEDLEIISPYQKKSLEAIWKGKYRF